MSNLVWYVCYGSNLYRPRFDLYLQGGALSFVQSRFGGCSNPAPPQDVEVATIPYQLYFARESSSWEQKSVAFLSSRRGSGEALCQAYLIEQSQFLEVWQQENGREPHADGWSAPWSDLQPGDTWIQDAIPKGWYRKLMALEPIKGYPAYTFTAEWDLDSVEPTPPGPLYLRTLIAGLKGAYSLSDAQLTDYFHQVPGTDQWPLPELAKLIETTPLLLP